MVRARSPRSRRGGFNIRSVLATGTVCLPDAHDRPPGMAGLKSAWSDLATELLADSPPGTRPWGYWAFDPASPWRPPLNVQGPIAVRGDGPLASDTQFAVLAQHGLFRPGERAEAERRAEAEGEAIHQRVAELPCIRRLRSAAGTEAA